MLVYAPGAEPAREQDLEVIAANLTINREDSRQWFIYTISDPRTCEVRYVGCTCDLERRVRDHLGRKREKTYKDNRVRKLVSEGVKPGFSIVEDGFGVDARVDAERRWIAYYRSEGANLTNLTDGGDGPTGRVQSAETRQKVSDALKGKTRPRDVVLRAMATKKLRGGRTDKQRASIHLICEGNIGRKHSPETLRKMSESRIGIPGNKPSLESRAKMSAASKGVPKSAAMRANLSAARKGMPKNAEWRAKLSESAKRRCARQNQEAEARIQAARSAIEDGEVVPAVTPNESRNEGE